MLCCESIEGVDMKRPKGKVTFDNQGRVVIVTGGNGGIGLAICQGFLDSGAAVVSLDVSEPPAGSANDRLEFIKTDVTDEAQCSQAVQQVVERLGAVDVLVNNAAIQPLASFKPLHELSSEVWRRLIDVNVTGYTLMGKAVMPQMLEQQCGVIINISSAQAHRTAREVPAYGPAKAANRMQAMQWGVEYGRHGIRVASVSPGTIDTPLVRASLEQQGGEAQLANRHPLGRIGKPHEIADAVLWLASEAASFVTATDVEVDGGLGGFASFAEPYPLLPPDKATGRG